MTQYTMIQRLRDKFGDLSLRTAVEMHTDYNKWEIEELTLEELTSLFHRFFPKENLKQHVFNLELDNKVKSLRSIILKDATYIGLLEPDNWNRFNNWMRTLSPLKKPLKDYKFNEFGDLIKQFKSLKTKYNKQAKIPYTKEWYHKHNMPKPSDN
ncbi:MAG: hypothetical protein ACTTJM_03190 [Bergeyella cardium]